MKTLLLLLFPFFATAEWFNAIHDQKMIRFTPQKINALLEQARTKAQSFNKKHRFLITDDARLHVPGYTSFTSIDSIDPDLIPDSIFLVFFHTDDDYVYTLKKIKDHQGIFLSLDHFIPKTRYSWVDKHALRAIDHAFSFGSKISHQNIDVHETICQALNITRHVPGDYVEIGVYKGGSALTALTYMNYTGITRDAYFFDTFDGMTYSEALESSDVIWQNTHVLWGVEETMRYVHSILETTQQPFHLMQLNICRDALPSSIKHIAVCNIDVDVYDATIQSLEKVAPLMVHGGIIICEDPTSTPGLGGALIAMEEFLATPLGKKFTKVLLNHAQYLLIRID